MQNTVLNMTGRIKNDIQTNGLVICFKTCICVYVNKVTFKCYNIRLYDKFDVLK